MEATKHTTTNKIQKPKIKKSPKGKANKVKGGMPPGRESTGHKQLHRSRNQENGSTEEYGPIHKTFSTQLHDLLLGKSNDTLLNKMGQAIDRGKELETRLNQEIPGAKNAESFFDKVDFTISEFISVKGKSKLKLTRKLKEMQEEKQKLKDNSDDLSHYIENLKTCTDQESKSHRNAITFYLAENKKLKEEIENLNTRQMLLEREKNELQEECSTSLSSLHRLENKTIKLATNNKKLNQELQATATDRKKLKSKHRQLVLENKDLHHENETLKKRLENNPLICDLNAGQHDCRKCMSSGNEQDFVRDCGRLSSANTDCSEISFANSSCAEI